MSEQGERHGDAAAVFDCLKYHASAEGEYEYRGTLAIEAFDRICTTLLNIKAERDELLVENERLREDAAQVIIKELVYKDGVFDATMKTGFGPILAAFVREMMKAYKGENFVTSSLLFADDIDAYYITFGRKFGKSVDEKYAEVCTQRDELLAAIKKIECNTLDGNIGIIARAAIANAEKQKE